MPSNSNFFSNVLQSLNDIDTVQPSPSDTDFFDKQVAINQAKFSVLQNAQNVLSFQNDLENSTTQLGKTITWIEGMDVSQNISNNKRMIEINTYYTKKYAAYSNMAWLIIVFCLPIIILAFLKQANFIPKQIAFILILVIVIIAGIVVGLKYVDLQKRTKTNFDSYNVKFPK